MKILIIEDDKNKLAQIQAALREVIELEDISAAFSYNNGLRKVIDGTFDLIIMDMSMPTFDRSPHESGGRFRALAGEDILRQMKRLNLKMRVIVMTQYESFGEEGLALGDLEKRLEREYPRLYLGTIFYNSTSEKWKEDLKRFLLEGIVN